jgi:serine/threonine-protein kinase
LGEPVKGIWARDEVLAAVYAVVFALVAYVLLGGVFRGLERAAYDTGVRWHAGTPSDQIAIIAIDDDSIANLGRWPWPRNLHAKLLDLLRQGGAKAVASTVFYSEAQTDPGAVALAEVAQQIDQSPLTQQIPSEIQSFGAMLDDAGRGSRTVAGIAQAYRSSALATQYGPALDALRQKIAQAQGTLATDKTLAASLQRAGDVILPMAFTIGMPQGKPDAPLPDYVRRNALTKVEDRIGARSEGLLPLPAIAAQFPIAELGPAAASIGHLTPTLDSDGSMRRDPLVIRYYDELYPSLALLTAAKSLNLGPADIDVRLGEGVSVGGLTIPTDSLLRFSPHFYSGSDGHAAFPVDSFYDVYAGKIPPSKYKDKIVLIGATARGIGDSFPTPVSPSDQKVVILADLVSSILQQDFYVHPGWAPMAEFLLFLVFTAYLALAVPRLGGGLGAGITVALALGTVILQISLMATKAMWLELAIPALFVVSGHGVLTVKKLNLTERLKKRSDVESAESNRMLGLAFQGQGQLDMAFDKFKRVTPIDNQVLDLLYNLALDFERKRQFNKATAVYEYIASHNAKFRDVQDKIARSRKMENTVVLGGASASTNSTLVLGNEQVEKPMLGRYQVEKELGKGAMGVVYLGKDPKIGRMVAIKTMALSQEFEPGELEDVKSRFFREAETAGRLSHPNIVAIYDAGEEHDLAYIAMEFIKGYDLARHVKKDALMDQKEVIKLVADAADALDYAHQQGIVHRDIKPANLMWLTDQKRIKVTDFGIARITDSSKTKTGMVLGTPSYMSPEQLAGKRVDGRSDLFSLGVTLYQLLTGSLPFQADSMATLMFKIANEPHVPPRSVRVDLPAAIDAIIERALQKNPDTRYAAGREFAQDLRKLLNNA